MSTDRRRSRPSRAEARRRARLAARGELPDERGARGGRATRRRPSAAAFLTRIFPPAPPLPGRPDPLAGFDRSGPLRPVRERLFLLRSNLLAWVVPGIVAFFGFIASHLLRARASSGCSGRSCCSARSSRRAGSAGSGRPCSGRRPPCSASSSPARLHPVHVRLAGRRARHLRHARRRSARAPRRRASIRPASASWAAGTAATFGGARRSCAAQARAPPLRPLPGGTRLAVFGGVDAGAHDQRRTLTRPVADGSSGQTRHLRPRRFGRSIVPERLLGAVEFQDPPYWSSAALLARPGSAVACAAAASSASSRGLAGVARQAQHLAGRPHLGPQLGADARQPPERADRRLDRHQRAVGAPGPAPARPRPASRRARSAPPPPRRPGRSPWPRSAPSGWRAGWPR